MHNEGIKDVLIPHELRVEGGDGDGGGDEEGEGEDDQNSVRVEH